MKSLRFSTIKSASRVSLRSLGVKSTPYSGAQTIRYYSKSKNTITDLKTLESIPEETLEPKSAFEELGVPRVWAERLSLQGISVPSETQRASLPLVYSGKDVILKAETGSGKTFCYLLPLLDSLEHRLSLLTSPSEQLHPVGIVVVPSLDLCTQILQTTRQLAPHLSTHVRICTSTQGLPRRASAGIVLCTPAHLENVHESHLEFLKFCVIDEADSILSHSSTNELTVKGLLRPLKMLPPDVRPQHIFCAATLPSNSKKKSSAAFLAKYYSDAQLVETRESHRLSDRVLQRFVQLDAGLPLSPLEKARLEKMRVLFEKELGRVKQEVQQLVETPGSPVSVGSQWVLNSALSQKGINGTSNVTLALESMDSVDSSLNLNPNLASAAGDPLANSQMEDFGVDEEEQRFLEDVLPQNSAELRVEEGIEGEDSFLSSDQRAGLEDELDADAEAYLASMGESSAEYQDFLDHQNEEFFITREGKRLEHDCAAQQMAHEVYLRRCMQLRLRALVDALLEPARLIGIPVHNLTTPTNNSPSNKVLKIDGIVPSRSEGVDDMNVMDLSSANSSDIDWPLHPLFAGKSVSKRDLKRSGILGFLGERSARSQNTKRISDKQRREETESLFSKLTTQETRTPGKEAVKLNHIESMALKSAQSLDMSTLETLPKEMFGELFSEKLRSMLASAAAGDTQKRYEMQPFENNIGEARPPLNILQSKLVPPTLVFVNSGANAIAVKRYLSAKCPHFRTSFLSADVSPTVRAARIQDFSNGKIRILVCTSLVARGIDTSHVPHVIQAEFSNDSVEFVHRVGRTGRAGSYGLATNLFMRNSSDLVKSITDSIDASAKGGPTEPLARPMGELYSFERKTGTLDSSFSTSGSLKRRMRKEALLHVQEVVLQQLVEQEELEGVKSIQKDQFSEKNPGIVLGKKKSVKDSESNVVPTTLQSSIDVGQAPVKKERKKRESKKKIEGEVLQ